MRSKKAILLFEILLVVTLVSIASVFLFRGYGTFIKMGRKSLDYLRLIIFCEEKMWDLELAERNGEAFNEIASEGDFGQEFRWELTLGDTGYEKLKESTVKISRPRRRTFYDCFIYLKEEQEEDQE